MDATAIAPEVLERQLQICVKALVALEVSHAIPTRLQPWAIAEEALVECRRIAREATGENPE